MSDMSDIVIRVEGLSKQYHIGGKQERYRTLRDAIADTALAPLRRFRSAMRHSGVVSGRAEDTIWALRDVSFEVRRGEVVGIIGRNGSGKSTLLKILSRITCPTAGWADIHGRVGSLLEVGTGFHPELTGRDNIYLNGAILGMKRAEIDGRFDEIIEFSEVDKFLDTPVKYYSSGMYLRLAFSVAAHLDPGILLVDEVLAVGDASFQKKCLGKMSDVSKAGRTVLFVSHNMAAVSALTSKCLLLDGGTAAGFADTEEIIAAYLHSVPRESSSTCLADRKISALFQFVAIELHPSSSAQGGSAILAGQSINAKLSYRSQVPIRSANLTVDMRLCDSLGTPVCTLSTRFSPLDDCVLPKEGTLDCIIPNLLLAEGNYTVDLWGAISNCPEDYVQAGASFSVATANFFGTGQMPVKRKHGPFLMPHTWQLHSPSTKTNGLATNPKNSTPSARTAEGLLHIFGERLAPGSEDVSVSESDECAAQRAHRYPRERAPGLHGERLGDNQTAMRNHLSYNGRYHA